MRGRRTALVAGLLICFIAAGLPASSVAAPGVSRRRITVGMHAPITGASPLAATSAEQGARLMWRWLRLRDRPINGRHVKVVLKNDQSNPATAVAVCKEMVEDDGVFLLAGTMQAGSGAAGTACARYAESVGVPYVGLGGDPSVVRDFDTYFSISATARRQARLLADMLVENHRARRREVGVVWADSADERGARRTFVRTMSRKNAGVDYDRSVPRTAGTSEARAVVQEMKDAGVDIVFILHSPVWFLNVLRQADTQGYEPLWTGVGPGMGSNDNVVSVACGGGDSIDGARFLTHVPAFADRDRFDRRHDRAMRRVYSDPGDWLTWNGWGTAIVLRKMLDEPGRRLTRRRFIRQVERSAYPKVVLPPVRFEPDDHFGARGVHVLRAECNDRRWHTSRSFVADF